MSSFLSDFLLATWQLTGEMAPYLLMGFAIAGVLHVCVKREWVQRWLGRPGMASTIKASIVGVPLPLCSCSVVPVAASLRRSGASRGATASFLSSTPQTGVDSILATFALLGGVFTVVRVSVAFICGIVTGYCIDRFCSPDASTDQKKGEGPVFRPLSNAQKEPNGAAYQSFEAPKKPDESDSCCGSPKASSANKVSAALRYGLVSLPAMLANALFVGLVVAGLIATLIPENALSGQMGSGWPAFLAATLISVPLYICATASIPMACALISAGLSPGAALVFLIAGPATNTATIATIWKMLGHRATFIYLFSLITIAWAAGFLFNATLNVSAVQELAHAHANEGLSLWQHLSAGALFLLLGLAIIVDRSEGDEDSCCAESSQECCN